MCCECCGVTQRKSWVFGLGTLFITLGTVLLIFWSDVANDIMEKNLLLVNGSEAYDSWVEAPIPIYLKFHMFNWTNPHEIRNPKIKPNFVEMGPYVFLEKHLKENVTFFPNGTIWYYEKRTWFFDAEKSNGTLDDMLTQAHVITATVADETRNRNYLLKKAINFLLNREGGELYATKPVGKWIFEGYDDRLIDFLRLFNTTRINMPYTKFGWLVDRNASRTYDGSFTIHSGVDDISKLGLLTHWNNRTESGFFPSPCGIINGTTGDAFPPYMNVNDEISIYATDACRYLNLQPKGKITHHGLDGVKWMGTNETLDSGENFPSQQCFCNPKVEECPKTGVVDCKKCRDNAPIYTSFPHFYLADPSYRNAIEGVNPKAEKHEFYLAIEPKTGVPLHVKARLQINMLMTPDKDYDIYRGVPKVMMPMFWFEQSAELDEKMASRTSLALHLSDYGIYAGIVLIVIGALFFITGIILTVTKRWKRIPIDDDDEDILTN